MITTARRCLGRLALLAAATATPVDYAADHGQRPAVIIFEASKNLARFRRVSGPDLWWLMTRQYLDIASSLRGPRAAQRREI